MNNILQVKIMTPRETLFVGGAFAVSSKNTSGKFDILAYHANFITIVENVPIEVLKEDRQKLTFKFNQAIIYNANNSVTVYAEPKTL